MRGGGAQLVMAPVQELYKRREELLDRASVAIRKGRGARSRELTKQVRLCCSAPPSAPHPRPLARSRCAPTVSRSGALTRCNRCVCAARAYEAKPEP